MNRHLFALLSVLNLTALVHAQTTTTTPLPVVNISDQLRLKALTAAADFRAQLVKTMLETKMAPAVALQTLKARADASGLGLTGDADYAAASLDLAHQLLGQERPDLAEPFFQAAEQGFILAAKASTQPAEKAGYLGKLGTIQAKYLRKTTEARANLTAALQLQPDNPALQAVLNQLPRTPGQATK